MQLTDRVHLVGGGSWGGAGLSPNPDCHVYLVDGDGPLALVDAGSGVQGSRDAICQRVQDAGFAPERIEAVLVTHMHGDHAGGAAAFAGLAGAAVHASRETVDVLTTADEEVSCVRVARDAGVYPPDYTLTPTDACAVVSDGDVLTVGDVQLTIIATPGHCAGHISYWLDDGSHRALFAGDAVFWRGRVLVQAIPDCDPHAMASSIVRLSKLDRVDGFFPGHGGFTIQEGARHIAAAAEQVATLRMPPGL